MQVLFKFIDQLWNMKWFVGHRTKIATICLQVVAAVMAYQGLAMHPELIQSGIDFPDLPASALAILGTFSGYFATKISQFSKEHTINN